MNYLQRNRFPLVLLFALATSAFARPVHNSFVNFRVQSPTDLIRQIKRDPEVADRYMRHFSMTKNQVVEYVATLHRDRLRRSAVYTVYSVPDNGVLRVHTQRLKAGEVVFEDTTGTPILMQRCGNPVTLGPNASTLPNDVAAAPPMGNDELRAIPEEVASTPAPDTLLAMTTPSVPEVIAPPAAPPAPGAGAPPPAIPLTATSGAVPAVSSGGLNLGPLVGLGLIGLLAGSHSSHHPAPPVPEPPACLALGIGAAVLLRKARSK